VAAWMEVAMDKRVRKKEVRKRPVSPALFRPSLIPRL
jgi:hypothetical protein